MKLVSSRALAMCLIALAFLLGCDSLKSEDKKITEALIGKIYEEDRFNEDGTKLKNIKGEFFDDGEFWQEATIELVDEETLETSEINFKINGEWRIEKGFIYYTFDYNSLTLTPEIYMIMKDGLIQELKDRNTPDKIIEYDPSKVVYEDSDGERHTMKKSY